MGYFSPIFHQNSHFFFACLSFWLDYFLLLWRYLKPTSWMYSDWLRNVSLWGRFTLTELPPSLAFKVFLCIQRDHFMGVYFLAVFFTFGFYQTKQGVTVKTQCEVKWNDASFLICVYFLTPKSFNPFKKETDFSWMEMLLL